MIFGIGRVFTVGLEKRERREDVSGFFFFCATATAARSGRATAVIEKRLRALHVVASRFLVFPRRARGVTAAFRATVVERELGHCLRVFSQRCR